MSISQLSIFIENKIGRLLEVSAILKNSNIDIKALSLSDNVDYGILRVIVDKADEAYKILRREHITCRRDDVLAVITDHKPGGLYNLLDILLNKNINVEYMYVADSKIPDNVVVILRVDEVDTAISTLEASGIKRAKLEDLK